MELTDRIWLLIARTLNHEASPEEADELAACLRDNPSLQQQFELLTRIWQETGSIETDAADTSFTMSRIFARAESEDIKSSEELAERTYRRRRRRTRQLITSLLTTVIIFSIFFMWVSRSDGKTTEMAADVPEELVARKGSRTRSQLPDGTTVWLNAGSRLFFVNDFSGSTREVRLEGEAFFDVMKQSGKLFIVHTEGASIRVLGTAFNVKSYPEDKSVETTLYRGKVEVQPADPSSRMIAMHPNEKLILPKNAANGEAGLSSQKGGVTSLSPTSYLLTGIDSTKKESDRYETAWLYSRLEFRGDNFAQLATKMERWYNVTIHFRDDQAKQLQFNGSFERETVAQALLALQAAVPHFKYQITNHEITIGTSQ